LAIVEPIERKKATQPLQSLVNATWVTVTRISTNTAGFDIDATLVVYDPAALPENNPVGLTVAPVPPDTIDQVIPWSSALVGITFAVN
jgi:hypothetical protein